MSLFISLDMDEMIDLTLQLEGLLYSRKYAVEEQKIADLDRLITNVFNQLAGHISPKEDERDIADYIEDTIESVPDVYLSNNIESVSRSEELVHLPDNDFQRNDEITDPEGLYSQKEGCVNEPLPDEIKNENLIDEITDREELADAVQFEQEEDSYEDDVIYQIDSSKEEEIDSVQSQEQNFNDSDDIDSDATDSSESPKNDESEYLSSDLNSFAYVSKSDGNLRNAFTLNDKYRFSRELFEGSETVFLQVIDEISSFNDIIKAEDYLYNGVGLDKNDENVRDFVRIIAPFFI